MCPPRRQKAGMAVAPTLHLWFPDGLPIQVIQLSAVRARFLDRD